MATPTLLVSGRVEPRKVIGSVDTSEFLVALAASLGFLFGIGGEGVEAGYVLALLAGGMIAAPFAAYLVRVIPAQMLGSMVGGIIVLTNSRTLVRQAGIEGPALGRRLPRHRRRSGSRRWPGRPGASCGIGRDGGVGGRGDRRGPARAPPVRRRPPAGGAGQLTDRSSPGRGRASAPDAATIRGTCA